MHEPRSNVPSSVDPSITAAAWPPGAESHGSGLPGGEIDPKLDLAARSRMASLRASMFGASAEPARVGRFVVLETLGAGGMGVVHAAYDPRLDRKIALKLVKPEVAAAGTNGEARLLREAQAMARLSHPNVVQIHEVGAWEGRVFIAMELVAGRSLATWLEVQPRGWREVVHMFAEAGRGLAAAHAAGMVHRDFKPENVLVGDDGRVRVTDFGLARGGVSESGAGETWREPGDPLAAIVDGMSVGTAAFAGTPRFMSPEQFLGEPATAASDQFSFCVALYVALHGVHPFVGEDRATLAKAVIAGERREPPRMRVPRKIHKAVVKGLARAPEGRFAGMGELLRAIEPRAGWQRVAPVALFAVTGAGAGAMLYDGDPCEDTSALLAGSWDDERREGMLRVLAASPMSDVGLHGTSASRALDNYTSGVAQAYTQSCKAHRRGEASSELHDLRVACLRQRLDVVRGVVDEVRGGEEAAIRGALGAVSQLEALEACENGLTLRLGMEPPPPGQLTAQAQLQRELSRAQSLALLGKGRESRQRLEQVLSEARKLSYVPMIAEVLFVRGKMDVLERNFRSAEDVLQESMDLAIESKFDALVGRIAAWLIQARVLGGKETSAAEDELRRATAWQHRGTPGPLEEADLEQARAIVQGARGDYSAAEVTSRGALELRQRGLDPDHVYVTIDRMNHANILGVLGRVEESIVSLRIALATMVDKVGAEHSLVAEAHYNLAVALLRNAGDEVLDEAEENLLRAAAIIVEVRGADAIELADNYIALAQIAKIRGDAALAQQRVAAALRVYDQHPGRPERAYALGFHGTLLFAQGQFSEALSAHVEVRRLAASAWGEASDVVGTADGNIGDVLLRFGDIEGAIRCYKSSLAINERALGASAAELLGPLLGLGEARLAQGDGCAAGVVFERALTQMRARGVDATEIADAEAKHRAAGTRCDRSTQTG